MTAVPLHGLDGSVARITLQCHTYVHIGTSAYSTREKKILFSFLHYSPLVATIHLHAQYNTYTSKGCVGSAQGCCYFRRRITVRRMQWYDALSI